MLMCVLSLYFCIFVNNKQPYDGCYPRDTTHTSVLMSLTADGCFFLAFLLLVSLLFSMGRWL